MNISLTSRPRRTVVGGAVLALTLGGFAAALPAQASAAAPAYGSGSSTTVSVSDSLNPDGVTGTDDILTCGTSPITIGGSLDLTIPLGCLTLYNGEWVEVTWVMRDGNAISLTTMELAMGTDGNLALTEVRGPVLLGGSSGPAWSSKTTFADNSAGPGCLAQFTSNADLVVDNCNNTSIWNSGAHTGDSGALLAFQGFELVIYQSSAGTALWTS